MQSLRSEMLWCDHAPSSIAENILRNVHRPTILPAPTSDVRDKARFEYHLKANGVGEFFTVNEIVMPTDPNKAESVGYEDFTPPAFCWGVSTLLVWLADRLRSAAGTPVKMRNHWRPQSYNALVSTSGIESDHPNAAAVDLDFQSAAARQAALDWLCDFTSDTTNAVRLSVGLGSQTLHVGVLSPLGSRYWTYASWGSAAIPEVLKKMAKMPVARFTNA